MNWNQIESEHEELVEKEYHGTITPGEADKLERLQKLVNIRADMVAPWPVAEAEAMMERLKREGKWVD